MAVRSKNLSGPGVAINATEKAIVEVEAGRTAIVKTLFVWTAAAAGRTVELYVHENPFDPGSGAIFYTVTIAAAGSLQVPTWFVLEPGQTLGAKTTTGAAPLTAAVLGVHGTYLLGAPE